MSGRSTGPRHCLQVLGSFAVRRDGRCLVLRPSARRLLALLAVRGALRRSDAAGLLWSDLTDARALGNLRTALWRARKDCPGLVSEEGDVVRISDIPIDLVDVRAWAWRAIRAEDPWMPAPDGAALELLPGWVDSWLVETREELRLLQLYALETGAQRLVLGGRFGEAAGLAVAAVGVDPLRGSANRLLIEIHLRDGSRLEALRQYRKYDRLLRQDLDIEPGPSLSALVGSLAASPRVAGLTLGNR
jgi:DNA-binding SARP family transcriptional activator